MHRILKLTILIFIFSSFLNINLKAQNINPVYRFSLGYGNTLLGTGDYIAHNFVFEGSKELKRKIEANANITIGLSSDHKSWKYSLYYFQVNLNFTRKIWQPTKFYTLKIGAGASFFRYSYASYFDQILIDPNTTLNLGNGEEYVTLGYNILINNEIKVSKSSFVNFGALGQFYGVNQSIGFIISLGRHF